MSATKDIDADALQLALELIADDTGDMPIDYCDVVELLAKLVDARDHWRGRSTFVRSDADGVTGVAVRHLLRARGWSCAPFGSPDELWRPVVGGRGIPVQIGDETDGWKSKTARLLAQHLDTSEFEVIDLLAAVARVRAKVIELSNAGEQVDDIAYQFGMTSAEVMEIVGAS